MVQQRLVSIIAMSCLMALGMAAWVFASGFGLLLAFLTYAFGGSILVLSLSAIALAVSGTENFETQTELAVS